MSESKKDAIIDRAISEERQLKADVAAHWKKLADIANDMRTVSDQIYSNSIRWKPVVQLSVPEGLTAHLDFSRIDVLLSDAREMEKRHERAKQWLQALGL